MLSRAFFHLVLVAAFVFSSLALAQTPYCRTLVQIKKPPFTNATGGQDAVVASPHYAKLLEEATHLGVTINWVDDVAKTSGIPLGPDEELEGYFDPNTNEVYLSKKLASIATIVHELRHAMHLGTNHPVVGTGFDRELQLLRIRSADFDKAVDARVGLIDRAKENIHELAEDMILKASELSAHYHDLLITREIPEAKEDYDASIKYRKKYHGEFIEDYLRLTWYRTLRSEAFPRDLLRAGEMYYVSTSRNLATPRR